MSEGAEQRVSGLARGDDFRRGRRVAVYDEAGVEHMLPLGERALVCLGPVDVRLHDRRAQRIIVIGDAGGGGLAGHVCPPFSCAPRWASAGVDRPYMLEVGV